MFCPKCGYAIAESDEFCPNCGSKLADMREESHHDLVETSNTFIKLLVIGVTIAILICVISLLLYGKIYFFNGYAITKVAWICAIAFAAIGTVLFIKDISAVFEKDKKSFCTAIALIAVIPAIFLFSSLGKSSKTPSSSYSSNYNDSNYYQQTYESCHSTYEHKQAIYSYDINNDNSISEYEMQLFLNAHPRVTNDKLFMDWLEERVG